MSHRKRVHSVVIQLNKVNQRVRGGEGCVVEHRLGTVGPTKEVLFCWAQLGRPSVQYSAYELTTTGCKSE